MRKVIALAVVGVFSVTVAVMGGTDSAIARLHPALHALLAAESHGAEAQGVGASPVDGLEDRFQLSVSLTGELRVGVLVKFRSGGAASVSGMTSLAQAG